MLTTALMCHSSKYIFLIDLLVSFNQFNITIICYYNTHPYDFGVTTEILIY